MNDLKALEEKYVALGAEIEALKAEGEEKEWPQIGVEYFILTAYCLIDNYRYDGRVFDAGVFGLNNAFRTKEEAIAVRDHRLDKRTQAIEKLWLFAKAYNGDWVIESGKDKHYLIIGISGTFSVGRVKGMETGVLFKDNQFLQPAIDALGDDVIRLACGEVG